MDCVPISDLASRLGGSPRKIAILKPSRVGDFICATPALRAIRMAFPAAEITLITLPMLEDLALRSPSVDRFAPFPGYPGLAEQLFEPRRALEFLAGMQAEGFDLALQIQGSGVYSNPFLCMLGARFNAGFVHQESAVGVLDMAVLWPHTGHEVERILRLPEALGIQRCGLHTDFPLWEEDVQKADGLLSGLPGPLIGIHPGARDLTRRWPADRFASAAARLQQELGGTVVIVGEKEAGSLAEKLEQQAAGTYRNLAGLTSLPQLGAVISRLVVLITNDSGPAHIAYALGSPSVTVFGGGDPRRYGPLLSGPHRLALSPIECRPCSGPDCPIGLACLEHVSVDEVVNAALEVIRQEPQRKPATTPQPHPGG